MGLGCQHDPSMETEQAKVGENVLEAEGCGAKGSESVPRAPFGASRDGEGLSQCMRVMIFQVPV